MTEGPGALIVTGGANGIGAAVARAAGRAGWAVAVNYAVDASAAEAVASEITAAGGRAAIRADVSLEADVLRLFAEAEQGVRVNAVAPGLIDTRLHERAGLADRMARMAPAVPLQRAGTPGEFAEGVLWLLSAAASYVTGVVLPVSGGR